MYQAQALRACTFATQAHTTFPEGDTFVEAVDDATGLWILATYNRAGAIDIARDYVKWGSAARAAGARHFLAQIGA